MSHRGESIRVMHPLFQEGQGGSIPTSPLAMRVEQIPFEMAKFLNHQWHSRLPRMGTGFVVNQPFLSFAAMHGDVAFAVAIWSNPVARNLPQKTWLELRRFALSPDCPKNTASWMLGVMARLIRRNRPDVETLVSYHDTEVHSGTIYRAAGWMQPPLIAMGIGIARSDRVQLPKAQRLSSDGKNTYGTYESCSPNFPFTFVGIQPRTRVLASFGRSRPAGFSCCYGAQRTYAAAIGFGKRSTSRGGSRKSGRRPRNNWRFAFGRKS